MKKTVSKGKKKKPRILIVTPEITYLPHGMGNMSNVLRAKAGGMADVSASLVSALYNLGADVHVALPHYRRMFNIDVARMVESELRVYMAHLSNKRVHLAEDRAFYYRESVYSNYELDSLKFALAFQREVINNIIPKVQPDIIHCNDWMTGLIPGMARRIGIPSLFTVHNIHTSKLSLAFIEDRGIDAAEFWKNLYYENQPQSYEESRENNRVDLLASGIFGAHFINTVSPTFLKEIVDGHHPFIPDYVRREIAGKAQASCAQGILNAPDPDFDPETDKYILFKYNAQTHVKAKADNKKSFQLRTGLKVDKKAPLFFWPSRLDPVQKGCQLLADIMYRVVSKYWDDNLQIAIMANDSFQSVFREIVNFHGFQERVVVVDFDDPLSHRGYAASDFMLMPSLFEPCGLPQMISQIYGSLPIVHDTGGLHDTVEPLHISKDRGSGFLFQNYDSGGLFWAMDEAMRFYKLPAAKKERQISRIMSVAKEAFNHSVTAQRYIDIYETMLKRPLV